MINLTLNWDPKPFKVLNCWFSHEGFSKFVEEAWGSIQMEGWGAYMLKEKLNHLRGRLKKWNKQSFRNLHDRRKTIEEKLLSFDKKDEEGTLSVEDGARKTTQA